MSRASANRTWLGFESRNSEQDTMGQGIFEPRAFEETSEFLFGKR